MKKTWVTVNDQADYVNLGVEINGELNIIQVNFINNCWNWGVTVVDPDGNTYTILNKTDSNDPIEVAFTTEDNAYKLLVYNQAGQIDVILCEG